jgi:hypothetical protein
MTVMFDVKLANITYHTGLNLTGEDLELFNQQTEKQKEQFIKKLISRRIKIKNIEVK